MRDPIRFRQQFATVRENPLRHRQQRLPNGQIHSFGICGFHNRCIVAPLGWLDGRSSGTTTCGPPKDRLACSSK